MSSYHDNVPASFALTSDDLEPNMSLVGATRWLWDFFRYDSAYVPGDDLGTCFSSYAAVVLSAVAIGTGSPMLLSGVTSFPATYTAAVCNSMDSNNLWSLENVAALRDLLKKTPADLPEIRAALGDAMESVWRLVWNPETYIALESLRQRVLYGGEVQRWLDGDALDYFQIV